MIKKEIKKSHYIEKLASAIKVAKPYFIDSESKLKGKNSKINDFPT